MAFLALFDPNFQRMLVMAANACVDATRVEDLSIIGIFSVLITTIYLVTIELLLRSSEYW
jgi:hypothetical protein